MKFKVGDRVSYLDSNCPFIPIFSRGTITNFDSSFSPTLYEVDFGDSEEEDVWTCREDELELVI